MADCFLKRNGYSLIYDGELQNSGICLGLGEPMPRDIVLAADGSMDASN